MGIYVDVSWEKQERSKLGLSPALFQYLGRFSDFILVLHILPNLECSSFSFTGDLIQDIHVNPRITILATRTLRKRACILGCWKMSEVDGCSKVNVPKWAVSIKMRMTILDPTPFYGAYGKSSTCVCIRWTTYIYNIYIYIYIYGTYIDIYIYTLHNIYI